MAGMRVRVRVEGRDDVYQEQLEGVEPTQVNDELADVCVKSIAARAQEDPDLTSDESSELTSIRFEGRPEANPDRDIVVAKHVLQMSNKVLEEFEKDNTIERECQEVIEDCHTKSGSGEKDEPDAPRLDFQKVITHLWKVFGFLITPQDLTRSAEIGSANVVVIRLATGIAYCYYFSVQLIRKVLGRFLTKEGINMMFRVIGTFIKYLVSLGFPVVLTRLGGWTGIANYVRPMLEDTVGRVVPMYYLYGAAGVLLLAYAIFKHFTH